MSAGTEARRQCLARDQRGASLIEFAIGLPVMLTLGGYGIETANLAIAHLRVSQIALALADNASRIGVNSGLSTYQLREADLNDVLLGAQLLGKSINLTAQGRITLSSLENIQQQAYDTAPVQRIHWQRCIGVQSGTGWDSSYGQATPVTTAGTSTSKTDAGTTSTGMGDAPVVTAPAGSGVIFVEINYQYRPLFGTMFLPTSRTKIHYVASFIIRDYRDYSQIFPTPVAGVTTARATCDLHTA